MFHQISNGYNVHVTDKSVRIKLGDKIVVISVDQHLPHMVGLSHYKIPTVSHTQKYHFKVF